MPKVSIVIPVYNAGRFLPQCLDSLLNQTYKDIEIICVNDGSTDNSLDILEKYSSKYSQIRVFSKENENLGAASARNMGLENVKGEYVQVLDSDDFFEEDMIEKMLAAATRNDADLVICSAKHFDERGIRTGEIMKRPQVKLAPQMECFSWKDCPKFIFQIADFVAWNKLFKRNLIEKGNLKFERIPISDDCYPSIIGTAMAERIVVIDEPFINYRINSGTSQVDSHAKHPEAAYLATFSIVEKLKELGVYAELRQSYLNLALRVMQDYYDRMYDFDTLKKLQDIIVNEVFKKIGADDLDKEFFYDERQYMWYQMVKSKRTEDIIFDCLRTFENDFLTAIARFPFPYESVEQGSNIVLVGKGLAGRYWYTQIITSKYCNILCWVEDIKDVPNDIAYDRVIFAK